MTITAATLFSGIGAPEVSMPHWHWLWSAEIEKFPSAVLAERFPKTINLGNVTRHDFVKRAAAIGRPDVLVFGSPCQDFSVAGTRLGLDGARGNLALHALSVARELGIEWLAFENVPGLFSSYSGSAEAERSLRDRIERGDGQIGESADALEDSDFATFLAAVQQCGYLGCWRVLDAQFAGVPQRRRRIFFVGRLGDWRGPASVLFEPESMRGDRPPSRQAGERVAPTIEARANAGGAGWGTDFMSGGGLAADVPTGAVSSKWSKGTGGPAGDECYNLIAPPLNAGMGKRRGSGTHGDPMVADPVSANEGRTYTHEGKNNFRLHNVIAFDETQITHPENRSQPDNRSPQLAATARPPAIAFSCKDHGADAVSDGSPTLRSMEFDTSHANGGGQLAVAFQTRIGRNGRGQPEEVVPSLSGADAGATSDMRPCVAVFKPSHFSRGKDGAPSDLCPPLTKETDKGDQDPLLLAGAAVRRLTPRECERLQGFPDDHTLISFRGKAAADGPRYKALGNAMEVNSIRWILERIEQVVALSPRK